MVDTWILTDGSSIANESVWKDAPSNKTRFVTHADYKALETALELSSDVIKDRNEEIRRLTDELAWARSQLKKADAELAECRKDAEKFRALTRCMDSITVEFSGLSMTLKPAPKAHVLLSAIVQGAINATDGIDNAIARSQLE